MKLSEQEIIEKKEAIILAAQTCFVRNGIHHTTMQDICGEAAMSTGNIYRYFESKEAIIEAFAKEDLQWITTAIQDLPSSQNFVEALIDTTYWTASTLILERKAELTTELFAEAGRNPRINAICAKFNKQLLNEICRILEIIEKTGDIHPVHDHSTIAQFIVALVDGFVIRSFTSSNFELTKMRPVIKTTIEALLGVDH